MKSAGFLVALGRWSSTLVWLMVQNLDIRYKRSRWGAILAIVEPIGIILIFALVNKLTHAMPAIGTSSILFFATGILPFYAFIHVSFRLRAIDTMRRFPRATELDLILSHVLDEFLTKLVMMVIVFTALWLYGISEAEPAGPGRCAVALIFLVVLGYGVGLINAVISSFLTVWAYTYPILMRALMAFSGVLFVMDWMPTALREWAAYNPVTHGVTWFRSGFYQHYPILTLDIPYALICTAGIVAAGWLLEDCTRQWRYSK